MLCNRAAHGDAGDLHAAEFEQGAQRLAGWLAGEPAIHKAGHTAGDDYVYALAFQNW